MESITQFEPLLIFVCFPYRPERPNLAEQEELLEQFRGEVLGTGLSEAPQERRRYILRKLLLRARALCPV